MKTLIIIAHPEVDESSSQQFLLASANPLENVTCKILTDKLYNIKEEQDLLANHDRIIFQFPMYWYSAPYLLKKWLDDVFTNRMINGLLKNKELGLVVTMGQSEDAFGAGRVEKFTLSELFKPFEALANKCQMTYLPIFQVALFSYLEESEKKQLLINYQQYISKENNGTFKNKEAWFINRFAQLIETKSPEDATRLQLILDTVIEKREELDELLYLVKEMREEDE